MKLAKYVFMVGVFAIIGCENRKNVANESVAGSALVVPSEVRPSFMATQPFELGGDCNMETVSSNQAADSTKPLLISGWGVDNKLRMSPQEVYIRIQDKSGKELYARANAVIRADVSDYMKSDYYKNSGYTVNLDIKALNPGTYDAMIVMNVGNKSILCSSGSKIVLSGVKK